MSEIEPPAGFVTGLIEIRTTYSTEDAAIACSIRLVEARLAACVQVDGPIHSTYWWQGAVEQADEWRCVCKTTLAAVEACVAAIVAGHPYETPQVVAVPIEASAAYAAWITETVRTGLPEGL